MPGKYSKPIVRERHELIASRLMRVAAVILGAAAFGGLALAAIRLDGMPLPPTWLAISHGVAALTGLGLLIYATITSRINRLAQAALGVFTPAVFGGATMFLGFHLREMALPISLVIGHGIAAAIGFMMLLASLSRRT